MDENCGIFKKLKELALTSGATRAEVIPAEQIETDPSFRLLCEQNTCGAYGKNWACPPDVGEIHELIARLGTYRYILVYQTVYALEDSFDIEGMETAKIQHGKLVQIMRKRVGEMDLPRCLHLGAGGCDVCPVCARATDEKCRFPDRMTASLESYGINVSKLAKAAGMKYINGQNTVTYFGAVLFDL